MSSLTFCEAARWAMVATLCVIVAYTDSRRQRIYNRTTVPLMLLGVALFTLEQGLPGLWQGLKGLAGGGLLLFVPFALNLVKAGDVKFMAALGALGGFWFAAGCALYGSLLQGLVALVVLLRRRELGQACRNIGLYLHDLLLRRSVRDFETISAGKLPHGVTLALGGVAALAFAWRWGTYFPFLAG